MKSGFALLVFALPLACPAQNQPLSEWKTLITKDKNSDGARALCTPYASSKVPSEQVEAEKCLANVELARANVVRMEKNASGEVDIFDEYEPAAVDATLAHLNRALQLAPQDLSIHQGRLHVLEISRRYKEMATALDESCGIYKGTEVPTAWLDYPSELNDLHEYAPALDLMMVLDKHYQTTLTSWEISGPFFPISNATKRRSHISCVP